MIRAVHSTVIAGLGFLVAAALAQAEPIIYPSQGQSPDQQDRDKYECNQWARQQTGVDPNQPAPAVPAAPAPPPGGAVRGAAGGAALGAVGGAIGGNAGKGAAIGAGVGALGGAMRRNQAVRQEQAAQQQAAGQAQANMDLYMRAYGACLEGRGYTLK